MKKIIKFYIKNQYGIDREFVHPSNALEASMISGLTGQKTITSEIRTMLINLTSGTIQFEQVCPPGRWEGTSHSTGTTPTSPNWENTIESLLSKVTH